MKYIRIIQDRFRFFLKGLKYGYLYWIDEKYRLSVRNRIKTKNRVERYGRAYFNTKTRVKKRILGDRLFGFCNICRGKFERKDLSIDHIIPISKRGTNKKDNLQLICIPCHREKDQVYNLPTYSPVFHPFAEAFEKLKV